MYRVASYGTFGGGGMSLGLPLFGMGAPSTAGPGITAAPHPEQPQPPQPQPIAQLQ
jgi:hypothetical protein